ncbi:hypothetical protein AURDEDRAFT_113763 [Auricularia subglabra TFB-10046 SS5]|nr:hypothetical protein AURDEDRAFT_113763 [Auricularia subglabra TFB-10046 SS5]
MLAFSRYALVSSLVASSAYAADILVTVGANGLKFEPNQVTANAGDVITFEFHPKNHTLTQSTLANPCTPVAGGGDSGYIPVAATETTFPTKKLTVPDSTTPLWFFCAQGNHCQQGMVFAVNPGTPEKMQTFLTNAAAAAPGGAPAATTPVPAPGPSSDPAGSPTTSTIPAPSSPVGGAAGTTGGKEIAVAVGEGGLKFVPESVTANVGDTIVFSFVGGNHSVTQSTFDVPCAAMAGGQDSDYRLASANPQPFRFTVTDATKPVWMFCKQGNHCQQGMVFSLNAATTGDKTADAFKAKAMGTDATGGDNTQTDPNAAAPGNGAGSRFAGSVSGLLVASLAAGLLL